MAKRPSALQIIGRIIKTMIYSVIAMMCGFLLWRIFFSTMLPREMRQLLPNQTLAAAYAEHGDSLVLFTQNQNQTTSTDENYGYFSVVDCVIIPEAHQVQLVLRYNNSTLKNLTEDFGLSSLPDRKGDYFDLTLIKTTDLTPDDTTDNLDPDFLEKTRYTPSQVTRANTLLYSYRRVVFDNVDVGDAVGLFFDIYYNEKIDYYQRSYGTLCLYDGTAANIPVALSPSEKSALRAALK